MDFKNLIKALDLPAGYSAPTELRFEDIIARTLSRDDLVADVKGINESIDIIQRTRGGGWPSGQVSEDFDYVDLVWHECEFRENYSFSYAVYTVGGLYLGCCYLYPMGRRTPLDEKLLPCDVDVSWWVTPEAYEAGYYDKLYVGLRTWIADAFPFDNPHFSNREIP
ncbi:MAG: GNAT family N-acetyltransferase [bacterium]